ncbi:hypothetical protein CK936_21505 [Streptomyces albireticuli]|uniref:ATP-grasp-modified RiPP n=2 Tax=Streptomyces albireticuli TaxID=1940 RepID=A0A2A2D6D8_9ACTN|nr:hypothetical protein CK936_21505 [Streptomyces albireticuli]
MFPKPAPDAATASATGTVRPFGVTLALPVTRDVGTEWANTLSYCPERQLTVTADGQPFIHAPSMKTQITSTSQTVEDMQIATDTENDTD